MAMTTRLIDTVVARFRDSETIFSHE